MKNLEFKKVAEITTEQNDQEQTPGQITNIETVENVPEKPKKRGRPRKTTPQDQGSEDKEPVKKKRGRPKGSTNKKKEEKKQEPEKFDPDAELEKIRKDFDLAAPEGEKVIRVEAEEIPTQEQIQLINGYMLLIVCDVFFPFVISYFMKSRLQKAGKQKKDLKLTREEKKELEPLADAAAKEISLNMSATQTFALTMLFMYADKVD
jgi:hypothetical protein